MNELVTISKTIEATDQEGKKISTLARINVEFSAVLDDHVQKQIEEMSHELIFSVIQQLGF